MRDLLLQGSGPLVIVLALGAVPSPGKAAEDADVEVGGF